MLPSFGPRVTPASLRRQFDALRRKVDRHARDIAAFVLRPVADQITRLWDIAVEKKQPKPNPVLCVQKVVRAGFRLSTFKALHTYIEDRRTYGGFPDADEIINLLLPPKQRVTLSEVLPDIFPTR